VTRIAGLSIFPYRHLTVFTYILGVFVAADTIPVTLYLDAETKQRIEALKEITGGGLNGFIRAAIAEHLKRLEFATQPPLARQG